MKKKSPYIIFFSLIFLIYFNTLLQSFHFDDIPHILQKPWIRGFEKIPQFIFSITQRPFVILSFNLNYAVSEFHVWSYHVFNILFHVGAVFLLFQLGTRIVEVFGRFHPEVIFLYRKAPIWSAALFALHPLNTQSVAYISGRSSVLATIFYLVALIFLAKGLGELFREDVKKPAYIQNGWGWLLVGTGFWGAGFLCKAIVITLPAVGFLFHYFFITRISFTGWLKNQIKWIAFGLGLLLSAIGLKVFLTGPILNTSPTGYSSADYLLTQSFVIPFEYLRKVLFPINLNLDIGFPMITDWFRLESWWGIFALLIILICAFKIRDRWIQFGLFWGLVALTPTSSFLPLIDPAMEHRMYLPMAGFCLAGGAIVCRLDRSIRNMNLAGTFSRLTLWRFLWAGWFTILILFAGMTVDRNSAWQNEVSLWSDAKKKSPYLVRPFNNLGKAYDKLMRYDEAITQFENALRLNPNYVFALGNIGNVYGKMGRYEESKAYFRHALLVKPDYAPTHYNLARALSLTGEKKEARKHYFKAVEFKPYFEEAWFNLAVIESEIGELESAIEYYKKFLEFQPRHSKAWFGLGMALFKLDYTIKTSVDLKTKPSLNSKVVNSAKTIVKYTIQTYSKTGGRGPIDYIFQGSNDDKNWTTLDTQTSQSWSAGEKKTHTFSNLTAYRYYKIEFLRSGLRAAVISEIEMMDSGDYDLTNGHAITATSEDFGWKDNQLSEMIDDNNLSFWDSYLNNGFVKIDFVGTVHNVASLPVKDLPALDKTEEAIDALLKAIKYDQKYLAARINLAAMYMNKNMVNQALDIYQTIIEELGAIPGVHKNLGILYSTKKNNPVKAAWHFRESLRLDPYQHEKQGMKNMILKWESSIIQKKSERR